MHHSAKSVYHLHSYGPPVINRDIKPVNVLVKQIHGEERAMLNDFGLAKWYDYIITITESTVYQHFQESLEGTQNYKTPELFMEDPKCLKCTATVDIFVWV